jgi:hypothetical protein
MRNAKARELSQHCVRLALMTAICVTPALVARAQHNHGQPALPGRLEEPMPLYPKPQVLGAFTRPVSSSTRPAPSSTVAAQRYFDQGADAPFAFAAIQQARPRWNGR